MFIEITTNGKNSNDAPMKLTMRQEDIRTLGNTTQRGVSYMVYALGAYAEGGENTSSVNISDEEYTRLSALLTTPTA